MSEVNSYRDIVAWQKSFQLGLLVYKVSNGFPEVEKFGLTSQLRRGVVSISSNIAEGYGRGTTAEYLRFLRIARGSLYEIDTQLQFAMELGYLEQKHYEDVKDAIDESERILAGLIRAIERRLENT